MRLEDCWVGLFNTGELVRMKHLGLVIVAVAGYVLAGYSTDERLAENDQISTLSRSGGVALLKCSHCEPGRVPSSS